MPASPTLRCLATLVALSGCAVTVQGSSGSGSDAAVADAAPVNDTFTPPPPPLDSGVPPVRDGGVVFPDAPLPPRDVPVAADRPQLGFTFVGRWRAVTLEFLDDEGRTQRVRDTDTVISAGGGVSYTARVNGLLLVQPQRLVYGVALLAEGHVFGTPDVGGGGGINAGGNVLAGTLDDAAGVFRYAPGDDGAVRFEARPDGTIAIVSRESGSATVFARDVFPVRQPSVMGQGMVQRPEFASGDTVSAALFWDRVGGDYVEAQTALATFGPDDTGFFRVAQGPMPPPANVRSRLRNTEVAVAYPSAYVDRNGDNLFGPTDGLRATPTFALVWRGEGQAADLQGTPFEDLMPGYSIAVLGTTYPGGGLHLVPLDNNNPIAPDVPYRDMSRPLPIRRDLPDLVP